MIRTGFSKKKNAQGLWTAWVWEAPGGEREYVRDKDKTRLKMRVYEMVSRMEMRTSLSTVTLEEYSGAYLEEREPSFARSTYKAYRSIHYSHIEGTKLGKMLMPEIKHSDIQNMINAIKGRNKTKQNIVGYIRTLFADAVADKLIDSNPCMGRFKYKTEVPYQYKIYTLDELLTLLNSYRPEDLDRLPILLASLCGMRLGEIMGLKGEMVDLENGVISVNMSAVGMNGEIDIKTPKTAHSVRKIYAPAVVMDSLKRFWRKGFIFSDDGGVTPWNGAVYTHRFRNRILYKNLPRTRFHDLRHFAATTLMEQGLPDKAISTFLGHADTNITKRYEHILKNTEKRPAEIFEGLLKEDGL